MKIFFVLTIIAGATATTFGNRRRQVFLQHHRSMRATPPAPIEDISFDKLTWALTQHKAMGDRIQTTVNGKTIYDKYYSKYFTKYFGRYRTKNTVN